MEGSISIIQWVPWLIGSSGLFGIALILFKIGRSVGIMSGRFDTIEKQMDEMKSDISEIKSEVRSVSDRLTRLEIRFEERTLRVIHVDKTGTEEKK